MRMVDDALHVTFRSIGSNETKLSPSGVTAGGKLAGSRTAQRWGEAEQSDLNVTCERRVLACGCPASSSGGAWRPSGREGASVIVPLVEGRSCGRRRRWATSSGPVNRATLICGDALTVLKTLPAESAQCCVTSPRCS